MCAPDSACGRRNHVGGFVTRTNVFAGTTLVAVLIALGFGQYSLGKAATAQGKGAAQAPRFEVDNQDGAVCAALASIR